MLKGTLSFALVRAVCHRTSPKIMANGGLHRDGLMEANWGKGGGANNGATSNG